MTVQIQQRLTAEDDPELWELVLSVLAEDAAVLELNNRRLYAEVGACSHWLRPHQTRWTAAGGFAAPVGYGGTRFSRTGVPEFDWSVRLQFDPARKVWVDAEKSRRNDACPFVSRYLPGPPGTAKRLSTRLGQQERATPIAREPSFTDFEAWAAHGS